MNSVQFGDCVPLDEDWLLSVIQKQHDVVLLLLCTILDMDRKMYKDAKCSGLFSVLENICCFPFPCLPFLIFIFPAG